MDVRAYVESHAREFIDDLKQWLAIPSVSYLWEELASAGSELG